LPAGGNDRLADSGLGLGAGDVAYMGGERPAVPVEIQGPVGPIAGELVLRPGCDHRTGGPRPLAVLVEPAQQLHVNRLGVCPTQAGGTANPLRPLARAPCPPPAGAR